MPENKMQENLAKIVHRLLTDRRGWRVDSMMDELGIKDRTYRKYRGILTKTFEPFLTSEGKSIASEVRDGQSRYLRLVDSETYELHEPSFASRVAALHFARQLLGFVADTPIGDATNDLLAEFKGSLKDAPYMLQHVLGNSERMFFQLPDAPKDYSGKEEILQELLRALIFRKEVLMRYSSASFDAFESKLHPYTLAVHRSALYLIGKGTDGEIRIYAVDRIKSVQATTTKFTYPSPQDYDPNRYTEGSFGIFRSNSSERIVFELIFSDVKWLKLYIRERRWHPTQKFDELADGRLRMTFAVNTDVEVWPWIRQFGDDVEVVRPAREHVSGQRF